MRGLLVCVVAGGCISPVMTFGPGKTAKQAQRDTMSDMGPARLVTGEKWDGEITTRKIRVWADSPYRTQNRQWQQTFEQPLELANLVLTPILGIQLTAEYQTWERNVPGATLTEAILALQEHDAGDDVFAVIGLTSSLTLVSATFDELGLAALGGRHVVLRGYADLAERKMYADAFPDLTADERELALVHLRHHKTAVVLLHELGHVLGANHEVQDATIMTAYYSNHATTFSPAARGTMLATVDQRLRRTRPNGPSVASIPATPAVATTPPKPAVVLPAVAHAPIVVRVTRKRTLIVDGKPVADAAFDELLKAAIAEDPRTKLVINEDKNLPAGVVGDLLDRAKAIGVSKIEFGWSGK